MLHRLQSVSVRTVLSIHKTRTDGHDATVLTNHSLHALAFSVVSSLRSRLFDDIRALAKSCNTLHAAFYAQHRLYAWTDEWAQLDSRDLFTISCFLRSCTPAQARDVPVYLAHSSLGGAGAGGGGASTNNATTGRTPYRLLTISLLHELELVLLCGPTPSLMDALGAAQNTILNGVALPFSPLPLPAGLVAAPSAPSGKTSAAAAAAGSQGQAAPMYQALLGCAVDFPRHIPSHFQFHQGILGFMYVFQRPPLGPGSGGASSSSSAAVASSTALAPSFSLQHLRMVSSFLPNATTSLEDGLVADGKKGVGGGGRRSPSPSPRRSPSQQMTLEPPSPSQFAPSNPLFSSSLLSEASVLSRSHALLGFFHMVAPQLFPPLPPSSALANAAPWKASPPPSPRSSGVSMQEDHPQQQRQQETKEEPPPTHTVLARSVTTGGADSAPSSATAPHGAVAGGAGGSRPALLQRAVSTPSTANSDAATSPPPVTTSTAPTVTDAYMLSPVSTHATHAPAPPPVLRCCALCCAVSCGPL